MRVPLWLTVVTEVNFTAVREGQHQHTRDLLCMGEGVGRKLNCDISGSTKTVCVCVCAHLTDCSSDVAPWLERRRERTHCPPKPTPHSLRTPSPDHSRTPHYTGSYPLGGRQQRVGVDTSVGSIMYVLHTLLAC